jgi:hypothetical protein
MKVEDAKKRDVLSDDVVAESMLISGLRRMVQEFSRELEIVRSEITALLRQYIALAQIHDLPDVNEPGFGTFPEIVKTQDEKAKDYRRASIVSALLGAIVTGTLSVIAFRSPSLMLTFLVSIAAGWLVGLVVFYWMLFRSDAGPDNPGASRKVRVWITLFGVLTFLSAAAFAWLRFASTEAKAYTSLTIVGFEVGIFALVGAFECGHKIFKWSREYHDDYLVMRQRRDDLEDKLAKCNADLQEHDYRLSSLDPATMLSPTNHHDEVAEEVRR